MDRWRHLTDPRRGSYTQRGTTSYTLLQSMWASLCHTSWHNSVVAIYCKKRARPIVECTDKSTTVNLCPPPVKSRWEPCSLLWPLSSKKAVTAPTWWRAAKSLNASEKASKKTKGGCNVAMTISLFEQKSGEHFITLIVAAWPKNKGINWSKEDLV